MWYYIYLWDNFQYEQNVFFSAIRCIHICHMWYYKFQRSRYSPSYALSFVDQQWALNGHLVACTLVTMCTKGDISTYFHHKMSRGESNGTVIDFWCFRKILTSKTAGRFSGPCWRFKMWFQKLQLQVFHPQESWGTTWKVVPGSIPFEDEERRNSSPPFCLCHIKHQPRARCRWCICKWEYGSCMELSFQRYCLCDGPNNLCSVDFRGLC